MSTISRVRAGVPSLVGRLGAMLVLSTFAAGSARAEPAACSAAPAFPSDTRILRTIQVYVGSDGVSHIKEGRLDGVAVPFFQTGKSLSETFLGPALKVVLVRGPANESIPIRTGIGRVMFLTLAGSSTVVLPSGEEATSSPGTLTIFDDQASSTGHGGRTGPCGYTALSIGIPKDAPTIPVQQ